MPRPCSGSWRTTPAWRSPSSPRGGGAPAGRWRASDQLYRVDPPLDAEAYLEVNPHAVVAVDSRGTIVYANPSVNGTFGWQPRELIGKSIDPLVPPDVVTRHAVHLAAFFAHSAARPMGIGR